MRDAGEGHPRTVGLAGEGKAAGVAMAGALELGRLGNVFQLRKWGTVKGIFRINTLLARSFGSTARRWGVDSAGALVRVAGGRR